jgi:hypothetical protein
LQKRLVIVYNGKFRSLSHLMIKVVV